VEGIAILNSAMEKFRALPPVKEEAKRVRQGILFRGCFSLGTISIGSGDISLSRNSLKEAITIARELGDKRLLGMSLEMFANASNMIKADDTVAAAEEGLEIFKEMNDRAGLAMAYSNLARWSVINGDLQGGEKYLALVQEKTKEAPVSFQAGMNLLGMAYILRSQGRFDLAQRYFEEGLKMFQHVGHKGFVTVMTAEIAHTQRAMGNYTEAKQTYLETIKVFQDMGNRPAVAHQLECFAIIAVVEGEPQHATKLFGAAEVLREVTNSLRTDEEQAEHAQSMSQLRSMLPEVEFNALRAEGRSMTMEQAIEHALSKEGGT
jgi:tetratricopeptide (TPR) repeat protein